MVRRNHTFYAFPTPITKRTIWASLKWACIGIQKYTRKKESIRTREKVAIQSTNEWESNKRRCCDDDLDDDFFVKCNWVRRRRKEVDGAIK